LEVDSKIISVSNNDEFFISILGLNIEDILLVRAIKEVRFKQKYK